jgi:hypothetical protein
MLVMLMILLWVKVMSLIRIILSLNILGLVLASPAAASIAYTVTDLGTGYACGINSLG